MRRLSRKDIRPGSRYKLHGREQIRKKKTRISPILVSVESSVPFW